MRGKFNKESGLHIRINLYIIRFLYCHVGSENNLQNPANIKKLLPAEQLYHCDYFPSRPRMRRICKGSNFDFSDMEADKISEQFGIEKVYFTESIKEPFAIEGISKLDWACLFSKKYKLKDDTISSWSDEEKNKAFTKVTTALNNLVGYWAGLKEDDPLFRICYFYSYTRKFVKATKPSIVLLNTLKGISYSDWDTEDITDIRRLYEVLKNHYNYLRCKLEIHELQEGQEQ